MDFNSLYNFIVVMEELSFTRAAKRLYMSQQAVSSQIKRMEEEYGVQLFTRKPTLLPTMAGTSLYQTAIQIIQLHQEFQSGITEVSSSEAGEIRLGISYGRSRILVPKIIQEMAVRCPNVRLKIVEEMTSFRMEESIANNQTDFYIGLTPNYSKKVHTIVLRNDPLLLVVPKKFIEDFRKTHDFPQGGNFENYYSVNTFGKYPFVLPASENNLRYIFNRYISTLHFAPNVIMESEQSDTTFSLALEGIGITIYPVMTYNYWKTKLSQEELDKVEIIPLHNMAENKLILGYEEGRKLSQVDNIFVDICQNISYFRGPY